MGKFMLNFANDDYKPLVEELDPKIRFVTAEEPPKTEGLFQKTLCYASYYVMTFTAFCAFAPGQVAHAASFVTAGLPL